MNEIALEVSLLNSRLPFYSRGVSKLSTWEKAALFRQQSDNSLYEIVRKSFLSAVFKHLSKKLRLKIRTTYSRKIFLRAYLREHVKDTANTWNEHVVYPITFSFYMVHVDENNAYLS